MDTNTHANDRQKRVTRIGLTSVVCCAHANHSVKGITTRKASRMAKPVVALKRLAQTPSNTFWSRLSIIVPSLTSLALSMTGSCDASRSVYNCPVSERLAVEQLVAHENGKEGLIAIDSAAGKK